MKYRILEDRDYLGKPSFMVQVDENDRDEWENVGRQIDAVSSLVEARWQILGFKFTPIIHEDID